MSPLLSAGRAPQQVDCVGGDENDDGDDDNVSIVTMAATDR